LGQHIHRLLWTPNVRCHVDKTPPLVSVLSQIPHLLTAVPVHSNFILSCMFKSPMWPLTFSKQDFVHTTFSSLVLAIVPAHHPLLDYSMRPSQSRVWSLAPRTPGLWVRIPFDARIVSGFLCVVLSRVQTVVLSCVQTGLATG
jgi:hypothetical protein